MNGLIFIGGMMVGAFIGIMLMAILQVAGKDDERCGRK